MLTPRVRACIGMVRLPKANFPIIGMFAVGACHQDQGGQQDYCRRPIIRDVGMTVQAADAEARQP